MDPQVRQEQRAMVAEVNRLFGELRMGQGNPIECWGRLLDTLFKKGRRLAGVPGVEPIIRNLIQYLRATNEPRIREEFRVRAPVILTASPDLCIIYLIDIAIPRFTDWANTGPTQREPLSQLMRENTPAISLVFNGLKRNAVFQADPWPHLRRLVGVLSWAAPFMLNQDKVILVQFIQRIRQEANLIQEHSTGPAVTEAGALNAACDRLLQNIQQPAATDSDPEQLAWEEDAAESVADRGLLTAMEVDSRVLMSLTEDFTPAHVGAAPAAWVGLLLDVFGQGSVSAEIPTQFRENFKIIQSQLPIVSMPPRLATISACYNSTASRQLAWSRETLEMSAMRAEMDSTTCASDTDVRQTLEQMRVPEADDAALIEQHAISVIGRLQALARQSHAERLSHVFVPTESVVAALAQRCADLITHNAAEEAAQDVATAAACVARALQSGPTTSRYAQCAAALGAMRGYDELRALLAEQRPLEPLRVAEASCAAIQLLLVALADKASGVLPPEFVATLLDTQFVLTAPLVEAITAPLLGTTATEHQVATLLPVLLQRIPLFTDPSKQLLCDAVVNVICSAQVRSSIAQAAAAEALRADPETRTGLAAAMHRLLDRDGRQDTQTAPVLALMLRKIRDQTSIAEFSQVVTERIINAGRLSPMLALLRGAILFHDARLCTDVLTRLLSALATENWQGQEERAACFFARLLAVLMAYGAETCPAVVLSFVAAPQSPANFQDVFATVLYAYCSDHSHPASQALLARAPDVPIYALLHALLSEPPGLPDPREPVRLPMYEIVDMGALLDLASASAAVFLLRLLLANDISPSRLLLSVMSTAMRAPGVNREAVSGVISFLALETPAQILALVFQSFFTESGAESVALLANSLIAVFRSAADVGTTLLLQLLFSPLRSSLDQRMIRMIEHVLGQVQ